MQEMMLAYAVRGKQGLNTIEPVADNECMQSSDTQRVAIEQLMLLLLPNPGMGDNHASFPASHKSIR